MRTVKLSTEMIKRKIQIKKAQMVKALSGDCNSYLASCCGCCPSFCYACPASYAFFDSNGTNWSNTISSQCMSSPSTYPNISCCGFSPAQDTPPISPSPPRTIRVTCACCCPCTTTGYNFALDCSGVTVDDCPGWHLVTYPYTHASDGPNPGNFPSGYPVNYYYDFGIGTGSSSIYLRSICNPNPDGTCTWTGILTCHDWLIASGEGSTYLIHEQTVFTGAASCGQSFTANVPPTGCGAVGDVIVTGTPI